VLSQPSMVGATSDTQVSARQRLADPSTLRKAHVRPPLSPLAGLLVIEPTPLTTPTVPGTAWGTQAGLLLLLLVGCATPDWWGHNQLERGRQDLVAAHPEWPPEILGAVASGVICAGMTPEMVRAAWGRPTRSSSDGSALNPRDIWHYAGRQHHADMMGGPGSGAQPLAEWTVAFTNGGVVGWTE
jgi:hypothetical protein